MEEEEEHRNPKKRSKKRSRGEATSATVIGPFPTEL